MRPDRPLADRRAPLHSVQSPFFGGAPAVAGSGWTRRSRIGLAFGALLMAAASLLAARPAAAVEEPVSFGTPSVLSRQGQRLKVVLPVQVAAGDRATAAAFLVRSAVAAPGDPAPDVAGITVLRPEASPYVMLQSDEPIRTGRLTMTLSVAGDPNSPYQMDLTIPPATAGTDRLAMAEASDLPRERASRRVAARRLLTPAGPADLPPK